VILRVKPWASRAITWCPGDPSEEVSPSVGSSSSEGWASAWMGSEDAEWTAADWQESSP
jgi:hypothetical protein